MNPLMNWLRAWWITFRAQRDPVARAILRDKEPLDYVEAERPTA